MNVSGDVIFNFRTLYFYVKFIQKRKGSSNQEVGDQSEGPDISDVESRRGLQSPYSRDHDELRKSREQMVEYLCRDNVITDPHVARAMRKVPRHLCLPPNYQNFSYEPYPTGAVLSSYPGYVSRVACLLKVKPTNNILLVGVGDGYLMAILAELANKGHVSGVEINEKIASETQQRLHNMGYGNISIITGDGKNGFLAKAPFDRIVVNAAAEHIPPPLMEQLNENGILFIPICSKRGAQFQFVRSAWPTIIKKTPTGIEEETLQWDISSETLK